MKEYSSIGPDFPVLSIGEVASGYIAIIILSAILRYLVFPFILDGHLQERYITTVALEFAVVIAMSCVALARPRIFCVISLRVGLWQILLASVVGIVGANISVLVALSSLRADREPFDLFRIILFVVVVPPIEELLFRGICFEALFRKYSLPLSILICSLAFASFHTLFGVGMIGGILLTCVYVVSRHSLTASIIAHTTTNLVLNAPMGFLLYTHYRLR